ncbi:prolyl oligopeptidase family protein [Amycolatopsis sp. NPDC059657]|uniref:prolyl oligopeptidase family serine peptidase n=1 Tax=Amycolatopsis sp. NPDC059657 TaxID=3346899 RepID=UPI00366AD575
MTIRYPAWERDDHDTVVLGRHVRDPYRPLEHADNDRVLTWLAEQDTLFAGQRRKWPHDFRRAADRLSRVPEAGAPVFAGGRSFFTLRSPDDQHRLLWIADADGGDPRVLVDPRSLASDDTATIDAWCPSREGDLLTCQFSSGGDEQASLVVLDVATGQLVDGPIDRCRYSPVAWLPGGEAFCYVRDAETFSRQVRLHRVGTAPADDLVVLDADEKPYRSYQFATDQSGTQLLITASLGPAQSKDLWACELAGPDHVSRPSVVKRAVGKRVQATVSADGRAIVLTDEGADRGRVCAGPLSGRGDWHELVPEPHDAVLKSFLLLNVPEPALLLAVARDARTELTVHALDGGRPPRTVALPGWGSVLELADGSGRDAFFTYTDYTTPASVFRYDAVTGMTRAWSRQTPPRPVVHVERDSYQSADGTEVEVEVISAGTSTEARPAILHGYGGFGVSMGPAYSPMILAWVLAGGVFAIAHVRGGGERGRSWHRDGSLDRKQRSFDDFHAAAAWLVDRGWTTERQLGLYGVSNGGLLVGAAITQIPGGFGAAVCSAPLLDMVRYERFGFGPLWRSEYGSAEHAHQLDWLISYSPYHRVREGARYPAVLFTVFEADSRVSPVHAYKMCAALQHGSASGNPVLLRRESAVGHGQRSRRSEIELAADQLAFFADRLGLEPEDGKSA